MWDKQENKIEMDEIQKTYTMIDKDEIINKTSSDKTKLNMKARSGNLLTWEQV